MRLQVVPLGKVAKGGGYISSALAPANALAVLAWHRAKPGRISILQGIGSDPLAATGQIAIVDDELLGDVPVRSNHTPTLADLRALRPSFVAAISPGHQPRPQTVFLDRDGTLIIDHHYLADAGRVDLIPGAAEALRLFTQAGMARLIVTNQSGIGRGLITAEALSDIHRRMEALFAAVGTGVDGIYICPHLPEAGCSCRKPEPGLVLQAARELGLDPGAGVVVGDTVADLSLGRRLGIPSILVLTGSGPVTLASGAGADFVVEDVAAAARMCTHPAGLPRFIPYPD